MTESSIKTATEPTNNGISKSLNERQPSWKSEATGKYRSTTKSTATAAAAATTAAAAAAAVKAATITTTTNTKVNNNKGDPVEVLIEKERKGQSNVFQVLEETLVVRTKKRNLDTCRSEI